MKIIKGRIISLRIHFEVSDSTGISIFTMHFSTLATVLATVPSTLACLGYSGGLPKHTGTKTLGAPQYIPRGTTFDAGWVKYDRGVKCTGQAEGGTYPS